MVQYGKSTKYYFCEILWDYIRAPAAWGWLQESKIDNMCLGVKIQDLKLAVPMGRFILGRKRGFFSLWYYKQMISFFYKVCWLLCVFCMEDEDFKNLSMVLQRIGKPIIIYKNITKYKQKILINENEGRKRDSYWL